VLTVKPRWTNNCATLQHGQWIPWINEHLPFNKDQAARYMRIFSNKELVKASSATHLMEAVNLVATPKPKKEPVKVEAELVDI
jgi:hypothetical protein